MRVGFVLAELFSGSAVSLWPSVASKFADSEDDCLVLFAGGRLNSPSPIEQMRNSIYRFVSPENLDGLIIWSSTLTGNIRSDDVLEHFSDMLALPMVTIDGKTKAHPEIPDVRFDAYEGSSFLVRHCIEEHGAKRIAYIRGPETHNAAQQRYQAYIDQLKKHGIAFDANLVADPVSWWSGDLAMRQFLEERHLVPGKDFDTLICASDLMLYKASQVLSEHGYSIGEDVRACGFNDSIDAKLLDIPVSTVRIPYVGLGLDAVKAFRDVVGGKKVEDKQLPMTHVLRRSCGCKGSSEWDSVKSSSGIANLLVQKFAVSDSDAVTLVERVVHLQSDSNVRSLIEFLCNINLDVFDIFNVLGSFSRMPTLSQVRKDLLVEQAATLLPVVLDKNASMKSFRERSRRNSFNNFNNELIAANRVSEIAEVLDRNAQALGFEKLCLVVMEEENSHLIGTDMVFPDHLIVPINDMGLLERGVWIVSPLCSETEFMGYLLMKPNEFDGSMCEEVRSMVSGALRSAMLFEATRRAQQAAESAETARTSFFANVGENLRDPLSDISDIVSSSALDPQVKKSIIDRITGANQMIDLALGSTGELELNRAVLNIGDILQKFDCYNGRRSLPCLLVDSERLGQAIEIIVSAMGENAVMNSNVQRRGVRVDIFDSTGLWREDPSDPGLSLARKIILLHNGTCHVENSSFSFILPFPTLSGNMPLPWDNGGLACINKSPDFKIEDVEYEEISGSRFAERKRLPAYSGAIYWDISFNGYNALTSLLSLVSNETYMNLPFICLDCPYSHTLEDSIRSSIEAKGRSVLQIGAPVEDLYRWLQDPEFISCDISGALSMCRRHEPEMVIITMDEYSNKSGAVVSFLNNLRGMRRVSQIPAIIVTDFIDGNLIGQINDIPNVIVVNSCMLESEEFAMRVRAILGGSDMLATHTGAIVKRAQAYLCTHATLVISRWQIADDVNVSEDYLTRVFKKELGLSPWDYLNRYRIWLAGSLLRNTGMSVNEVSIATGFQDQAYFCRVFKKIRGYSPSKLRTSKKSEMYKKQ
ncbi:MAG: substrate-binding domain-containing protein [Spirochaetales bacterium]|nr:substrate-binding domain-containing protein [Spirochaetales bacterium]